MSDSVKLELTPLQEVLESIRTGSAVMPTTKIQKASHSALTKKWEQEGQLLSNEHKKQLRELPVVLGSTVAMDPVLVNEEYTNSLAHEIELISAVQDILKGRMTRLKELTFTVLDYEAEKLGVENPELFPGYLAARGEGVKLSRIVTGGIPYIDIDKAREFLPTRLFKTLVDTVETKVTVRDPSGVVLSEVISTEERFNLSAVDKAIIDKRLDIDQLREISSETPRTTRFLHPRLKDDE